LQPVTGGLRETFPNTAEINLCDLRETGCEIENRTFDSFSCTIGRGEPGDLRHIVRALGVGVKRYFFITPKQFSSGFEFMHQKSDQSSDVNPYTTNISDAQLVQPSGAKGDETGGLIPYKNPAALAAYYLGIFSILPVLGLFLAVPALILGVVGLVVASWF